MLVKDVLATPTFISKFADQTFIKAFRKSKYNSGANILIYNIKPTKMYFVQKQLLSLYFKIIFYI